MLLVNITDGINEYNITDIGDGRYYNDIFYSPFLIEGSDISFSGDVEIKLTLGTLTINLQKMDLFVNTLEFDVDVFFTPDSSLTNVTRIFKGKAVTRSENPNYKIIKLKQEEDLTDLLDKAPNLIMKGNILGGIDPKYDITNGRYNGIFVSNEAIEYEKTIIFKKRDSGDFEDTYYLNHFSIIDIISGLSGFTYNVDKIQGSITVTGTIATETVRNIKYTYSKYKDEDIVYYDNKYYCNLMSDSGHTYSPADIDVANPWTEITNEDLLYSENRFFPLYLGNATDINGNGYPNTSGFISEGKYPEAFLLNENSQLYWGLGGVVTGVFDGGVPLVNGIGGATLWVDNGNGTFNLLNKPIEAVTCMTHTTEFTEFDNPLYTIVNQVNKKRALEGLQPYILDLSLAKLDLQISMSVAQQRYWKDVFSELCEYAEHIWYIDDLTIKVISKIDDVPNRSEIEITDYEITSGSISSTKSNEILNTYRGLYTTQFYNNAFDVLNLEELQKELTIQTGLKSGIQKDLNVLDFRSSEIQKMLDRKKTTYLYDYVSLKLAYTDKTNTNTIKIGNKVELSSKFASGELIITSFKIGKRSDIEVTLIGRIRYEVNQTRFAYLKPLDYDGIYTVNERKVKGKV